MYVFKVVINSSHNQLPVTWWISLSLEYTAKFRERPSITLTFPK